MAEELIAEGHVVSSKTKTSDRHPKSKPWLLSLI
jgi:hypothetical protein